MMHFFHRSVSKGVVILNDFWRRVYVRFFSWVIGGAFYEFGGKSVITPPVRLSGVERISIGRGVFVGAASFLNVIEPARKKTPAISIGSGTSITGAVIISAYDSIIIEESVLIAANVYIADHSHRVCELGIPIKDQGIDCVAPVRIGRGAWICQNVVICPGVTIGRGSIVGANSVVKSDVPEYSIAVGAPSRVVRTLQQPV